MTRMNRRSETGATLVVSLIMLTLITLMIIAALAIGSANFKTVTNMQFRDGAVDAANRAIEQVVSSSFALAPAAETINVDLDNNGTPDYEVQIALPVCVQATQADVTDPSSESLSPAMGSVSSWNTVWDIRATVAGTNPGQAAVDVRAGVRVLLSEAQKDAVCT
jgi:Tfp pilus assembly protein PilX